MKIVKIDERKIGYQQPSSPVLMTKRGKGPETKRKSVINDGLVILKLHKI